MKVTKKKLQNKKELGKKNLRGNISMGTFVDSQKKNLNKIVEIYFFPKKNSKYFFH